MVIRQGIDDLGRDVRDGVRSLARRPAFTAGGHPFARPRHRGQHGHLQPRQRRHPPRLADRAARGGRQPLSPPDVVRVQHALLPRLQGRARRHRRGLQRHRGVGVRAGAGGPRRGRRGRRGAGRGGHRGLLPDAGHRGRGRPHAAAERRRLARRTSGRHARPPLLARRLRRRPGGGRARDARRRPGVHGGRGGAARLRGQRPRPEADVLRAVHDGGGAARGPHVRQPGPPLALRQGAPPARRRAAPGGGRGRGGGRPAHPGPHRELGPDRPLRARAARRRAALPADGRLHPGRGVAADGGRRAGAAAGVHQPRELPARARARPAQGNRGAAGPRRLAAGLWCGGC